MNAHNDHDMTPLMYAAQNGHFDVVKKLLSYECIDVYFVDQYYKNALMYAVEKGYFYVGEAIMDKMDCNLSAKGRASTLSLMQAVACGKIKRVEALLGNNMFAVNIKIFWINTLLMHAAQIDCVEMVNFLMNVGAEVNAQSKCGKTALMYAGQNGRMNAARALLENPNINLEMKENFGKTALILAAENNNAEMVKLLMNMGAEVNAQSDCDMTALMYAIQNGSVSAAKALLENINVDLEMIDSLGKTALMLAVENGNEEMVNYFIKKKVDMNAKSECGMTALMIAVENGYIELLEALLKADGIDVSLTDEDGKTALMYAAQKGDVDAAKALLKRQNIDLNAKEDSGKKALMTAWQRGHFKICKLIFLMECINKKRINGERCNRAILVDFI